MDTMEGILITEGEGGAMVKVTEALKPVDFFLNTEYLGTLVQAIRTQAIVAHLCDVGTVQGRKEIASYAYRVAQTKTFLDNIGKAEVAKLKDLPKKIDEGRRILREGLEALQAEVRGPLNSWEAQREAWRAEISKMQNLPATHFQASAEAIAGAVEALNSWMPAMEELTAEAESVKTITLATMVDLLEKRQKDEAEKAELERLRLEDAARRAEAEKERLRQEGEERARRAAESARMVVEPVGTGALGTVAPSQSIEVKNTGEVGVGSSIVFKADQKEGIDFPGIENQRTKNREVLEDIKKIITDDILAIEIVRAIAKGRVRNVKIIY